MHTQSQHHALWQALGIDVYVLRKRDAFRVTHSPRLAIVCESPPLSTTTQPLIADLVRTLQLASEEIVWIYVSEGKWPSLPSSAENWLVLGNHLATALREKLATTQPSKSFAISVAARTEEMRCDIIHKRSLWQTVKLLLREFH